MKKTVYEILGVDRNSSQTDLKKAYRSLASKFQDRTGQGHGSETHEKMSELNAAWDKVKTPEKREEYDAYLGDVVSAPQPYVELGVPLFVKDFENITHKDIHDALQHTIVNTYDTEDYKAADVRLQAYAYLAAVLEDRPELMMSKTWNETQELYDLNADIIADAAYLEIVESVKAGVEAKIFNLLLEYRPDVFTVENMTKFINSNNETGYVSYDQQEQIYGILFDISNECGLTERGILPDMADRPVAEPL